jgi:hypothetical protein
VLSGDEGEWIVEELRLWWRLEWGGEEEHRLLLLLGSSVGEQRGSGISWVHVQVIGLEGVLMVASVE